jgi:hypothetical protein
MSARHQMAGLIMTGQRFATLSNLDMQQCPKMFCNFVQKVLAKNNLNNNFNKRFDQTDSVYIFEMTPTCKITRYGYAKNEENDLTIIS